MKLFKSVIPFVIIFCMLASLFSGCGLIKRLDQEDEQNFTYCEPGGSIVFPEGFAPKGTKNTLETTLLENTLCASFTQVPANKSTDYFYPLSDTLTLTANGTTDGVLEQFRISLWKYTESGTQWVETLYFRTNGETATGSFSGLDPNSRYRLSVSFSGSTTSCTGSFNASPISMQAPTTG